VMCALVKICRPLRAIIQVSLLHSKSCRRLRENMSKTKPADYVDYVSSRGPLVFAVPSKLNAHRYQFHQQDITKTAKVPPTAIMLTTPTMFKALVASLAVSSPQSPHHRHRLQITIDVPKTDPLTPKGPRHSLPHNPIHRPRYLRHTRLLLRRRLNPRQCRHHDDSDLVRDESQSQPDHGLFWQG
jgi:hypothetical protein